MDSSIPPLFRATHLYVAMSVSVTGLNSISAFFRPFFTSFPSLSHLTLGFGIPWASQVIFWVCPSLYCSNAGGLTVIFAGSEEKKFTVQVIAFSRLFQEYAQTRIANKPQFVRKIKAKKPALFLHSTIV